ncbi:MAG: phosphatidylinositol kinase [Gammaproteobacteria bacterium MedPE]|nr:MAG: phosphatidylinositol kinase [Gammaproteobacteria bacterium MedPE]
MAHKTIQKLLVHRRLSNGNMIDAGILAQNKQGVFFQYDASYLAKFGNLSPFTLRADTNLNLANKSLHSGLHGVFADALPDGWGLLLQDRIFRQNDLLPAHITAMDRLAFVGDKALGGLSFSPVSGYASSAEDKTSLSELGINAQKVFDGQAQEVLAALVAAGSSGGARPKAQIYVQGSKFDECHTIEQKNDDAWIVKFTSSNLALGHEEGLCEAAYLTLAKQANLNPPQWTLLNAPKQSGAKQWLALKRFDFINNENQPSGRLHMHSACGLLDTDFRTPSLDYDDLIRASRTLCKSPAVGQLQFRRAMFNLLACNHDDHSKNWAFLQNDHGAWQPAPFYDVTFSPHPFGEHATSFGGYGKTPPLKAAQKLAHSAGFAKWSDAKLVIEETVDVIENFQETAQSLGVSLSTSKLITKQLITTRKAVTAELL